eukprot:2416039-Pyramimonas_sp.AAC.1
MWLSPESRAYPFSTVARVLRIEGGLFSKCGSRLSAVHIRLQHVQELHGLRAECGFRFSATHIRLHICKSFTASHG